MTPDPELLASALGREPSGSEPVNTGGYTRSRSWRATTPDGIAFVKEAEDEGSLSMLRREAVVYGGVTGSFAPAFIGFAEGDGRALLAIEFLDDVLWPPPYPEDVTPLFDALEAVAASVPPPELPAQRPRLSRWEQIAAEPASLLGLGVCSRDWLDRSLDTLIRAEASADFTGDALAHNDVYSGNVGFRPRGAVLVDWGAAVRGSPWIDVAFALHSVRVEGGEPPSLDFPDEGPFAAALAGLWAHEAPMPLPDWADPESNLRSDMAIDLASALAWASELLGLPPPR